LDGITEGAACTVLAARSLIDNSDELMIANSDQYIDASIDDYLEKMQGQYLDGMIMTMTAVDPKWSYVGLSESLNVTRVAEKQVISNEATVGIYNFARGSDFVSAADKMIEMGLRVNNEYYVAPVYNQLIDEGYKIGTYNIGCESAGMHGLGTPSDLETFLATSLSKRQVCKL
jgi:dTDP-glucose pyrophosphorylase